MRVKEAAALTHVGVKRKHNEDAVLRLDDVPAFAVADGMGGSGAGDVAAQIATTVLRRHAAELQAQARAVAKDRSSGSRLQLGRELETLFHEVHQQVGHEAGERDKANMATTLVSAVVAGDHAYIAHVGDSRAYLLRAGTLRLLTDDHTLAMLRLRQGRMSEEEFHTSPLRHRLYQALGAGGEVDVDTLEVPLADDDLLLLCSDGITTMLPDAEIARLLVGPDLQQVAYGLVSAANARGGQDNIGVVLVRVGAEHKQRDVDAIAGVLASVFLFRGMSDAERHLVAPYLEEIELGAGERLFSEDDPADHFYVIVEGRVRITKGDTHLVDVGPGGHLGELCLSRPVPRSATVTALDPALVFALSRDRFQEIVQRRPILGARLAMSVLETVGDRLRDLTDRIAAAERVANGELTLPGVDVREAMLRATRGQLRG